MYIQSAHGTRRARSETKLRLDAHRRMGLAVCCLNVSDDGRTVSLRPIPIASKATTVRRDTMQVADASRCGRGNERCARVEYGPQARSDRGGQHDGFREIFGDRRRSRVVCFAHVECAERSLPVSVAHVDLPCRALPRRHTEDRLPTRRLTPVFGKQAGVVRGGHARPSNSNDIIAWSCCVSFRRVSGCPLLPSNP